MFVKDTLNQSQDALTPSTRPNLLQETSQRGQVHVIFDLNAGGGGRQCWSTRLVLRRGKYTVVGATTGKQRSARVLGVPVCSDGELTVSQSSPRTLGTDLRAALPTPTPPPRRPEKSASSSSPVSRPHSSK